MAITFKWGTNVCILSHTITTINALLIFTFHDPEPYLNKVFELPNQTLTIVYCSVYYLLRA